VSIILSGISCPVPMKKRTMKKKNKMCLFFFRLNV
jgi:hypothetical protein